MILVNGIEIEQNHFPDGTLNLKYELNSLSKNIAPINIKWFYENDGELFTIICLAKKFADHKKFLNMPYCPHARMDRIKKDEDTFTLKYFCEIINSLNFDKVYIEDIHSPVALALLENVINLSPITKINYIINSLKDKDLLLFFPDEGAMKRYADELNKEYAFGIKKRDWSSGKILGLELMNKDLVENRNVLIIDDICSTGGTFYHSANALKKAGAKNIYLYITHAENTMVKGPMYNTEGLIEKIYTTESIFNIENDELNKVIIIDQYC